MDKTVASRARCGTRQVREGSGWLAGWLSLAGYCGLAGCAPTGFDELAPAEEQVGAAAQAVQQGKHPPCPSAKGLLACGERCVQVHKDPQNCGACGEACPPGQSCSAGVCVPPGVEVGKHADPGYWSQRGPRRGGRLDGIVTTADMQMVGSPGGGAYRKGPAAPAWYEPQMYGTGDYSIVHLAFDIHPDKQNRLYAQTWNGLYVTTDFGDWWTALVGLGGSPAGLLPHVEPDVVDPKPFAQMMDADNPPKRLILVGRPCEGFYYSYGDTWDTFQQHVPFPQAPSSPDNCIGNIAADPISKRIYFSTLATGDLPCAKDCWQDANCTVPKHWWNSSHVFRSTAPWTTGPVLDWECANEGLPWESSQPLVAALESASTTADQNRMVALFNWGANGMVRAYVSLDGGASWTIKSQTNPGGQSTARPLLFTGGHRLVHGNFWPHWSDATKSEDLGRDWFPFSLGYTEHVDTRALFWSGAMGKLWTANDGADQGGDRVNITEWTYTGSWPQNGQPVPHTNIEAWQAYYAAVVATDGSGGRRAWMGVHDNRGACSDNLGLTWPTGGNDGFPDPCGAGDQYSIVFAPSDPSRAYARSFDANTLVRTDMADLDGVGMCTDVHWDAVCTGTGSGCNCGGGVISAPLYVNRAMTAVHPTNKDLVAFATYQHVVVSVSGGDKNPDPNKPAYWRSTLPGGAAPTTVLLTQSALYAGSEDHGVYQCTDMVEFCCNIDAGCSGSSSWQSFALNSGSPKLVGTMLYVATTDTWWVATSDGLYRRRSVWTPTCSANAWCVVTGGDGYIVNDVAADVDPECYGRRVYAAFGWGGGRQRHRGGIRVSHDNGESWSSITAGVALHQAPVTDIETDPFNRRLLYAASFGRGFWVYDWGADPPQCTGN